MGTRFKPQGGKIESLDDVNIALRDIGLAERELDAIDTAANKEIAQITGCHAEAVRKQLSRGREQLKKRITP